MTVTQWLFVAGLLVVVAALSGIAAVTWQRRHSSSALLGLLFAAIAVVSTINLTLVGHRVRVTTEDFERRFADRLACTQSIVAALEGREEARTAGADPKAIALPDC